MNNYGVILDDFGFYEMIQEFIQNVVKPLARCLWSGIGEDGLDSHHAFTVEYGDGKDRKLDKHYDDAEVTINYCMG